MTMRVQRQAGLARAQPAKVRVTRRRCVVVNAEKKSVGDLTEADLKGKAVFVRAGEPSMQLQFLKQYHHKQLHMRIQQFGELQQALCAARSAGGCKLLRF